MPRLRSRVWAGVIAGLALAALLLPTSAATGVWAAMLQAAQGSQPQQCFPETGKCVRGAFLVYWQQHGGLEQFGFPISDEIMERNAPPPAGDGQEHLVQYFQRARFEFHENPGKGASNVKLGLLGSEQWQDRHAASPPPPVQPQPISDPVEFCAKAGTVDYPTWLYQGVYTFTGTVKDPASGASAGLRCLNGQPLICLPGASDWMCNKVNFSTTPTERTVLYCQIKGDDSPIPGAYVDKTSAYLWTCQQGKAVIEKQVVTEDQVDARGYRIDSWKPLPGTAQPQSPSLAGTSWSWLETKMGDGALIKPSDPTQYTIAFNADGTVAIQADCNRVAGTYTTTSAQQLTITLGPTTLAACPPGSEGQRYTQQLSNVVSYLTRDGDLYLAIKFDSGIMHFTPLKPASLAGTMWSWTETKMSDGAVTTVTAPARYTIQFNADGSAAIQADCNRVRATYTTSGAQQLTITLGASTLAACPPGSQDQLFLSQLGQVVTYTMNNGDLFLALKFDSGSMHMVPVKPTALTGPTWSANGINNGRNAVQSLVADTVVTADFGTDGQVTGSAGCNSYSGPYTVTGNAIAIGPLATTRMACPEPVMTQEQAFLAAMQNATVYNITADRLELRDAGGALQVGFIAQQEVSGAVTYRQRIALASGSVVTVQLQDVSRADAPSVLLGEQVITTTGQQVPIAFAVGYDPSAIVPQNSYTVRATINDPSGKMIFTSTTAIPVITRGAPTSGIEIVVEPV